MCLGGESNVISVGQVGGGGIVNRLIEEELEDHGNFGGSPVFDLV